MEAWVILVDRLATPSVVFTLALLFFLLAVRSPWPWTRSGGAFCGGLGAVALGLALTQAHFRQLAADPERLPVLILALASCVALWVERHRTLHAPDVAPATPWPGLSPGEVTAAGAALLAVAFAAFFLGAPLLPAADPAQPPLPLAAPWFFLGLQEIGRYVDSRLVPWALPALVLAGLAALPYLDLAPEAAAPGQPERRDVYYFFLFAWFLLGIVPMLIGAFLRGPDGRVVGPFGSLPPGPVPLPGRSLAELFWSLWGAEPPTGWWLREWPALVLLGLYFAVLPWQLPRLGPTRAIFARHRKRLGRWRFYAAMVFVLLVLLLPLAMYARWLAGIGALLELPG